MGAFIGRWVQTLTIGAVALAPLALTVWILWLLVQLAALVGGLLATPVLSLLARGAPEIEAFLQRSFVPLAIELAFALGLLTLAGVAAGNIIGRTFGGVVGKMIARLPIAGVIYASARQLVQGFQTPTEGARKVVLIEFPSEHMKTVGFVTKRFRASDTGEELAAVYVPTTPNPTSGYVEIVPVDRLVWLDWSTTEALQFVVSGGVSTPARIRYRASVETEP